MERFQITVGDIAQQNTQAVVNATDTTLLGGGEVSAAIRKAAGPQLAQACEKIGGCATGKAVVTPGFSMSAQYIIHTPGPLWQGGGNGEKQLLASCYHSCLTLAGEKGILSIAFPSISTGAYHFPVNQAAEIAVKTIGSFLSTNTSLKQVLLVCRDQRTRFIYEVSLQQYQAK